MRILISLFFTGLLFQSVAQSLVRSGPMNAFSDHREAAVWVQTKSPASVAIRFREKGTSASFRMSEIVQTSKVSAFAATLLADSLLPGKRYEYEVLINGKKMDRHRPLPFRLPHFGCTGVIRRNSPLPLEAVPM